MWWHVDREREREEASNPSTEGDWGARRVVYGRFTCKLGGGTRGTASPWLVFKALSNCREWSRIWMGYRYRNDRSLFTLLLRSIILVFERSSILRIREIKKKEENIILTLFNFPHEKIDVRSFWNILTFKRVGEYFIRSVLRITVPCETRHGVKDRRDTKWHEVRASFKLWIRLAWHEREDERTLKRALSPGKKLPKNGAESDTRRQRGNEKERKKKKEERKEKKRRGMEQA